MADSELEKLMVRLEGEDAGLTTTLDRSIRSMLDWAKASGTMEEAQKHANAAQEAAGKHAEQMNSSLGNLQSAFRSLSSMIGVFSPQAGFAARSILDVGTAAASAMTRVQSLSLSLRTLTGAVGAHPAMFGVGIPLAVGAAAVTATYQIARAERDRMMMYSERYYAGQADRRGYIRSREMFDVTRTPIIEPSTGYMAHSMVASREQVQARNDELMRRIARQRETEQGHLSAANVGSAEHLAALGGKDYETLGVDNISGYFQHKQKGRSLAQRMAAIPDELGGMLERPEHRQALDQFRNDAKEASKALQDLADSEEDAKRALEELDNQMNISRMQSASQAIRSSQDEAAKYEMGGREYAVRMFIRQNNLEDLPGWERHQAIGDFKRQWEKSYQKRTEWEAQGLGYQTDTLRESRSETVEPLNVELRIQNEVNQAKRAYYQEHHMNMPPILASYHEIHAAQRQEARLTQEGFQVYMQFMLPIDRAIMNASRLSQQFDALKKAGMADDEGMQWARLRSSEAGYGEAHKDFSQYTLGQQHEAIQSNTSQYTRGLWEYTMGSTAIPADQMRARQKAAKVTDLPMFAGPEVGLGNAVDDPAVVKLQGIKDGIDILVIQGEKRLNGGGQLLPAGFK